MKTIACLLLVCLPLFTVCASSTLIGARPNGAPYPAYRIRPGLYRSEVLAQIGAPVETYSPNVWIYVNVAFAPGSPAAGGRDALVVQFTDERVSRIVVTDSSAVKAYLAQVRCNPSPRVTVSK
jgi:hypothetical protein